MFMFFLQDNILVYIFRWIGDNYQVTQRKYGKGNSENIISEPENQWLHVAYMSMCDSQDADSRVEKNKSILAEGQHVLKNEQAKSAAEDFGLSRRLQNTQEHV